MKFPEENKNEEADKSVEEDYKITVERLKEAVDYVFKQEPRKKAQKGEGEYIEVYENENALSIKVKTDKGMSFMSGAKGFYNMLDAEDNWVYRTLPIKYNGVVLDDEQTKQFWEQTDKFREEVVKRFESNLTDEEIKDLNSYKSK